MVLLAAAVLTTLTGDWADTIVIAVVVTVNTTVSVWQEVNAQRAVSALSRLASPTARVVRSNEERVIATSDVVPGDLVLLGEGDRIPADGVVIEAAALAVDESSLTGESIAVDKTAAEPVSRLFAGTTVVHGRGRALVTATGARSALGRISGLLDTPRVATPLQRRISQLSRILAAAVVGLCAVVFAIGLLRGEPVEIMLLTGVSLAVAAVPESLPVVVTLSLAMAARRMAQRHAIVRSLTSAETLGAVTLLATDKTGTLTHGTMSVTQVVPTRP